MYQITIVITLALWVISSQLQSLDTKPSFVTFNKTIISNSYYYRGLIDIPRSNRINLTYRIQVSMDKCCPILGFIMSPTQDKTTYEKFCYDGKAMYMAMYVRNYIYMKENFPFSGCASSSGYLICTGMRTLVAP